MATHTPPAARSNSYNLFILVLTVLSLVIMALLLLPLDPATLQVLLVYDNVICGIFLLDFALNLTRSHPPRDYLIHQRGWIDLLGSIPSLGFFRATALLRLFRISRLARIARLLREMGGRRLVADMVRNRGQYAAFITLLTAIVILTFSSIVVLQVESRSPDANIKTGGDALWWAIVTMTTVGYGDYYPVTSLGRLTGVVVMFTGVGIIGALASILASVLVPSSADTASQVEAELAEERAVLREDLAGIRAEMAALRESLGPTPNPDKQR